MTYSRSDLASKTMQELGDLMVDNHEKTQRAKFDLLSGIVSREETNEKLRAIRDELAEISKLLKAGGKPDLAESAERLKDDIAADVQEDSTIMKCVRRREQ